MPSGSSVSTPFTRSEVNPFSFFLGGVRPRLLEKDSDSLPLRVAVSVAVNAWSLPDALYHCLSISQSALAIVDDERANLLSPLLTQLKASGCKQVFVVRMSAAQIPAGMESFNDAVARAPRMPVSRVEIVDEDDCCMFFTSGTTGMPKAVFSSQRMYLTNTLLTTVAAVRAILRRGELPPAPDPNAPQKGMALVTPLFHVTVRPSRGCVVDLSCLSLIFLLFD